MSFWRDRRILFWLLLIALPVLALLGGMYLYQRGEMVIALHDCLVAAFGVERFRLKHKSFPKT